MEQRHNHIFDLLPPAWRREFYRSRLQSFFPGGFIPRGLPSDRFFANVDSDGKASSQKYFLWWNWGFVRSTFCYLWVRYAPVKPGWSWSSYEFRRKFVDICDGPCYEKTNNQCINWCKDMVWDWESSDAPIDLSNWEPLSSFDAFARSGGRDWIMVGGHGKTWNLIL